MTPFRLSRYTATLALLFTLAFAASASAQTGPVNGAIFTSNLDASIVNQNIYDSKGDVYLSGGPQNHTSRGLDPGQGDAVAYYYFMVTDPGGQVLLSNDDIKCRVVVVRNGRVQGVPIPSDNANGYGDPSCYHTQGTANPLNGQIPVQLCGATGCPGALPALQLLSYYDTPNPGGEYKAWMTPVEDHTCSDNSRDRFGFCAAYSKTDNFKVKVSGVAYLSVCKFNDLNANGIQDPNEPLIPHWPITATGVDGGTVETQTGDNGCVSFAYSAFSSSNPTRTVTLAEGTQPLWTQTAPVDGTHGAFTVSGGVISVALSPGESLTAPAFGNTNPYCSIDCSFTGLVVTTTAYPSLTRRFKWDITKSVDQTRINTSAGGAAMFAYTVSVTHDAGTDSGWLVTGSIRVANPSGVNVTGVVVTDVVDNGGSCTTVQTTIDVQAGGHVDVPYTCTYSSLPNPGTNTATAALGNLTFSGPAAVDFANAVIAAGDGSVTVADSLGEAALGTVLSTDPSPTNFTYAKTFTAPSGTCNTVNNTATFSTSDTQTTGSSSQAVKYCGGADLTVAKTAKATLVPAIAKTVDNALLKQIPGRSSTFNYTVTVTEGGWNVAGNITVTNPNDWEDVTVNVLDNNTSCTVTGGSSVLLGRSSSVSLPYSCTFTSAPPAATGTNTATANWDGLAAATASGSNTATANYSFPAVTVTDPNGGGTLGTITTPAARTVFTYAKTFTGDPAGTCTTHPNTASFAVAEGTTGSASQSVQVCVGADLTVAKTATPYFTRTYNWAINKSVDKTRMEQVGGSAIFNYTVAASETGFIDSVWVVSGTITVTNPNDWEGVSVSLADSLNGCSISNGSSVVVPKSGSIVANYSCPLSAGTNGTNTVTASWDQTTAYTPDAFASGQAGYVFSAPTTRVNQAITITDTLNSVTTTLGTLTATDAAPFTSSAYTYSHTLANAIGGQCATYNNTAFITQTRQSSNQTVNVCNTATGGLTKGFWQNKNGQALISGANQALLAAYLRGYASFANLTVPLTTYATGVINAANASGSSMNAMLKAQMLATALDVYFSDPLLGGNKIGAATPIGSVRIDLTQVCTMLAGSGGVSACSGTFNNASAAFGGATSRTVSQLLAYAASQANVGGSLWYGNVKALQELAKNTFDAINNQAAYVAP